MKRTALQQLELEETLLRMRLSLKSVAVRRAQIAEELERIDLNEVATTTAIRDMEERLTKEED